MPSKKLNKEGLTVQEQIAIRERNNRYAKGARERKKALKLQREADERSAEVTALLAGDLKAESIKDLKPLIDKNLKHFLQHGSASEKLALTKEGLKYIYGDQESEEQVINVTFRIEKDITPISQELQGEGAEEKERKKPAIEAEGLPQFFKEKKKLTPDYRNELNIRKNVDEIAKQVRIQQVGENLTSIEAPTSAEEFKSRIINHLGSDLPQDGKAIFDDEFLQKVHASRNKRLQQELKAANKLIAELKYELKQAGK